MASWNGVKINKVQVTNNLPQFVGRVQVKAARSMTQALILGGSEATALTPIDTGTLINSQYRTVEARAGKVVGTVGYTAEYAMAVHDPANPQNFRRASAEKEFLKQGFERAEPNIRAVITGAIKTI
jgi:hypothetical protein